MAYRIGRAAAKLGKSLGAAGTRKGAPMRRKAVALDLKKATGVAVTKKELERFRDSYNKLKRKKKPTSRARQSITGAKPSPKAKRRPVRKAVSKIKAGAAKMRKVKAMVGAYGKMLKKTSGRRTAEIKPSDRVKYAMARRARGKGKVRRKR